MPTYEYYCEICDLRFENSVPMVAWTKFGVCPECGNTHAMQDFGTPPNTVKPLDPYYDAGAGQRFETHKERRDWMKSRDVVEIGDDKTYLDGQKELLAQCRDKRKLKT